MWCSGRSLVLVAVLAVVPVAGVAEAQARRSIGAERFERLDADGSGDLDSGELRFPRLLRALDRDEDGKLSRSEAGLAPAIPPAMVRSLDHVYVEDAVDPELQSLDIYAPLSARAAPVMVMIHGGGWAKGDKGSAAVGADKAAFFVAEGWVHVSINYRLSPAVVHPAHVEDVAAALAWVHGHIGEHGGDPERIFVMGHSAGAHLAALVATDSSRLAAHGHELSMLSGVILLDGAGYDIAATMTEPSGSMMLERMYSRAFGDSEAGWRDASPSEHVAPGKGIPPFLVIHAGQRQLSAERSRELARALVTAGSEAVVFHAVDDNHGSVNREIGEAGDDVTGQIREWLAQLLATTSTDAPVAPLAATPPLAPATRPSDELPGLHDW